MTDGTASGEQHTYGDEAAAIKVSNANESWSCLVGNRTGGQGKTLVTQLLFEMNSSAHTTVVLVTHDRELASRCGRMLVMEGGRLV